MATDSSTDLKAQPVATPEDSRIKTSDFITLGDTPGNVAICLSGGGSRALTAGMGQLRGLRHLSQGGKDLVSLARLLSTVSGGSWLGTTWSFIPSSTPDDAYLNQYAEPEELVPRDGPSTRVTLDTLPDGNLGKAIDAASFSPLLLAFKLLLLRVEDVPTSMLWQTLIAIHILKPYGLYRRGHHHAPKSLFSYDTPTLEKSVTGPNPSLAGEIVHLVTPEDADHSRRPYLVCNCSIFVQQGQPFESLAPLQCTPFWSGLIGNPDDPDATDPNGRLAGGGGVTSFAFNSQLKTFATGEATVTQSRQWSLTDIVGTSSAFFAQVLQDFHLQWKSQPSQLVEAARSHRQELMAFARRHLSGDTARRLEHATRFETTDQRLGQELLDWLEDHLVDDVKDLIPQYPYWPVRDPKPLSQPQPSRFADGGDLENMGVADALAYDDVERVISCINSENPLMTGDRGVMVPDGTGFKEVPGTRINVSSQVPPLFGYQPYVEGVGYLPYAGDDDPTAPIFRVNQVFEPDAFPEFLTKLWKAMGNTEDPATLGPGKPGKKQGVPRVFQTLRVVDNDWFHVHGTNEDGSPREVQVMFLYLDRVRDWYDQLQPDVQSILGDFDDPKSYHSFPNYPTVKTDLDATQINLMSNLTAWCLAGQDNAAETLKMFQ